MYAGLKKSSRSATRVFISILFGLLCYVTTLQIAARGDTVVDRLPVLADEDLSWSYDSPLTQGQQTFLAAILSYAKRQEILPLASLEGNFKKRGANPAFLLLFKLYAFDEDSWLQLFENPPWDQPGEHAFLGPLKPAVLSLPGELRSKIASIVRQNYVSKKDPRMAPSGTDQGIYAKRFYDGYIRAINPPDRVIAEDIYRGLSVYEAYDRYLKNQHQQFFEGTEYGTYGAAEVFEVAQKLQNVLENLYKVGHGRTPRDGEDIYLKVLGSFSNGRSRIALTDLDMVTNDWRMPGNQYVLGELRDAFSQWHGSSATSNFIVPALGHDVTGQQMTRGVNALDETALSSVALKVKRDGISLIIYSGRMQNEVYGGKIVSYAAAHRWADLPFSPFDKGGACSKLEVIKLPILRHDFSPFRF